MSFLNLPAELRALPQWCVYRLVVRGEGMVKPPLRLDNLVGASVHEPDGWGTFEQAIAVYEANRSVLDGIGFMLTEADPYVVIDFDKVEKMNPAWVPKRRDTELQTLELGSYAEVSPSGKGIHVWFKGRTRIAGKHYPEWGSEVYAWQRFITCTGKPVSAANAGPILEAQAFLEKLGLTEVPPKPSLDDDSSKPTSMSDHELYQRACQFRRDWGPQFHGKLGGDPGEWSHTFVAVVGTLDELTGNVEQIFRMMRQSPLVTDCEPAGSGERRTAKCERILADTLSRVRRGNRASRYFVDHGRQIWEAMERTKKEQAERFMREQEADIAAQVADAEAQGGMSPTVVAMLDRFTKLSREHRDLTVPPGMAGYFVAAANAASKAPYVKFAIPATLATLAGITARAWMPDRGGAMPLNYVLVAPSSTGKTQTMKVWQRFIGRANERLGNLVKPVNRIVNNGAASVQGIMPDLQEVPCCVWTIEEASSQLNAMANPSGTTEENLRTCYNEFYDCGEHGHTFQPPRSVASRNSGIKSVEKLCVSTYWTTTPSKFKIENNDVLDGFASRVVFIRHTGPGGLLVRDVAPPPEMAVDMLSKLLGKAAEIDRLYEHNSQKAFEETIRVDTTGVGDLDWEMTQVCARINYDALSGALPETYTAVSRIPQSAMRLACLLAIMDNPWVPVVNAEHYRWAFGYLLQNQAALLNSMDKGEIGDKIADDVLAAVRAYKELVKAGESKGLPGVPRSKLLTTLKSVAPFRSAKEGRTQAARRTLDAMVAEGFLEASEAPSPTGKGPRTQYLRLGHAA